MMIDSTLEPLTELLFFDPTHMNTSMLCLCIYHLASYIHHGIKMHQR